MNQGPGRVVDRDLPVKTGERRMPSDEARNVAAPFFHLFQSFPLPFSPFHTFPLYLLSFFLPFPVVVPSPSLLRFLLMLGLIRYFTRKVVARPVRTIGLFGLDKAG